MYPIKTSKNEFFTPFIKKNILERKLFSDKLQLSQKNQSSINPNYSENFIFFNENFPKKNINKEKPLIKDEEDDYNIEIYNLSISKDKNFFGDIISNEEITSSKTNNNNLEPNGNEYPVDTDTVEKEKENLSEDLEFLKSSINLFIQVNKENKMNNIKDKNNNKTIYNSSFNSQYYNYIINSLDTTYSKQNKKMISKFSKEYRKNKNILKLSESSTIPVHSRVASQPFQNINRHNQFKKNNTTDINNKEDYSSNIYNSKISNYTKTNTKTKSTTLNEDFENEENPYLNHYNNNYNFNNRLIKSSVLEENYLFDSSGNQKFLCVKRFKDDLNDKTNKRQNEIKEIVIKNVNVNYLNNLIKKRKMKKNIGNNITERIEFYSPQISYNNIYSPKKKRYINKLSKKDRANISNDFNSNYISNKNRNYKNHINTHSNINNIGNNKIYILNDKLANVKVDYSKRNNFKFHEIKSSKENSLNRLNSRNNFLYSNYKNNNCLRGNNKIINSTSMDNIKYNSKYNNMNKILRKDYISQKKQ